MSSGGSVDRIIIKTQAAVIGDSTGAVRAAKTAVDTGARVALVSKSDVPDRALLTGLGIEVFEKTDVHKIIFYPEGRVAGIMCSRIDDKRKIIINGDAFALDTQAATDYAKLFEDFGARIVDGTPLTRQAGLVVCETDKSISGVYIIDNPDETGRAAGVYALDVDRRIYSRFRGKPMERIEPVFTGDFMLTIIGMPDVPKHKISIREQDGALTGTHETENDLQDMQNVRVEDEWLCWNLWSGTTSSELFTFQLMSYSDVWLGGTWRIDTENALRTPVMMQRVKPVPDNPQGVTANIE